jgi:acetyl esterase
LRRADGQRVSWFLGSLLGGSTLTLNFAAKHPTPLVNAVLDRVFPLYSVGQNPKDVRSRELDAGGVPARLYEPPDPTGLVVYIHGGGFALGSLKTHRVMEAFAAKAANCRVLAIAYRKGPADPFPAAYDDCVAALRWTLANAESLGVDADRIAIGGDSAGGQLAAAACLALSDDEPKPRCAWLFCPLTDGVATRYASARLFEKGPLLTAQNVKDMVGHYATGADLEDPRLNLMGRDDLGRMPPTYVATAGMDPIRDQGEQFANKLRLAGVDVTSERFPNLPHDFGLALIDPGCRAAWTECCDALRRALTA